MTLLLLPLAAGALLPGRLEAHEADTVLQGSVLSIGDGDSLRVSVVQRRLSVRLACIDAPEMAQRPWGSQSRAYLRSRLPIGSAVTLLVKGNDRYGRTVAEVIGEINLGLTMVEDGQAFVDPRYLSGCDRQAYMEAERRADRRRYGIWQAPGGITRPWQFRRQRGRPSPSPSDGEGESRTRDNVLPAQRWRAVEAPAEPIAWSLGRWPVQAMLDAPDSFDAAARLPRWGRRA